MEQITEFINKYFRSDYGFWLPPMISTHGAAIDQLIAALHWFMLVLFIGWGAYLVYCLLKFRESNTQEADLTEKHFSLPKYIEFGVIAIEACLLIFFSYPIWARYKSDFPAPDKALHIKVVAEQFAWNVHYPGPDGKFGKTDPAKISVDNAIGLVLDDPDAKDDLVTLGELTIPVNKPVIVDLSSKDVIHSFFLPVMRVKQDAIPGMEIPVWFEATQTGDYQIACAQLCGVSHYNMFGQFNVRSSEDFQKWFDEKFKETHSGT